MNNIRYKKPGTDWAVWQDMCICVQILFHFLERTWRFSGFLFSAEVLQQGSYGNQGTTILDFPDITTIKLNFKWIFTDAANQKLWTHVAANVSVYLGIKCFFCSGRHCVYSAMLCIIQQRFSRSTKSYLLYIGSDIIVTYFRDIFMGFCKCGLPSLLCTIQNISWLLLYVTVCPQCAKAPRMEW